MNKRIKKKKIKQQQEKLDLLIATTPVIMDALKQIIPKYCEAVVEITKAMIETLKNIDWNEVARQIKENQSHIEKE